VGFVGFAVYVFVGIEGSSVKTQENGAGEGNRTLVFSLEGCCSTIELHPRRAYTSNIDAALNGKKRKRGFAQLFLWPLTNGDLFRWGEKKRLAWRLHAC
jgi:hypothetical protein